MSRVNAGDEIGRNDPCPCGSGKKYKKCCMGKAAPRRRPQPQPKSPPPGQGDQLRVAMDHARAGRLPQAEQIYHQVLQTRPTDAAALYGLAEIRGRTGQPQEGVKLLRRAIAAGGRQAELHSLLSYLLLQVGDIDEAEQSARHAIKLDPNSESAHRMLADCHHRMRRLDEAIAEVKKALAADPTSLNAEIFLAALQRENGDLTEARSVLERVLDKDVPQDLKHRALTELGFVLDKLGEPDTAFEMFERAGAENAETPEARRIDRGVSMKLVDDYKAVATKELLSRWTRESFDDALPRPSFLVGFPRSGTTLTEQVLAAHPDVVTADEKDLIRDMKTEMSQWFSEGSAPEMLPQLERDDVARLRAAYWRQAEAVMQMELSDKVFVDKLPLNLVDLPLINVMFPEARVIVALRDPRDVCLSCFMQRFGLNTAMINFLSWENTAEYYARVMDLWLRLREMVTLEFIEVRYEDTVEDFETQARRLIDFLGAAWDDGVLEFHEKARKRFISTPSFTAVTQRVHRGAMARWRKYPTQVERISESLQPFITAFGYS
jgi:tetratricopeptide (TPR) repeat protein